MLKEKVEEGLKAYLTILKLFGEDVVFLKKAEGCLQNKHRKEETTKK